MYKEACVLLKKAGWWDDFNDYADKNEWVRPAVGAGLLGLGGAGVGALTGGAKGAAIGGGAGVALGGTSGWLVDYLRKARLKRQHPQLISQDIADQMAMNAYKTQQRADNDNRQRAMLNHEKNDDLTLASQEPSWDAEGSYDYVSKQQLNNKKANK